jgi:hypothetical protein
VVPPLSSMHAEQKHQAWARRPSRQLNFSESVPSELTGIHRLSSSTTLKYTSAHAAQRRYSLVDLIHGSNASLQAKEAIADLKTQTGKEAEFLHMDLADLLSLKRAAQEFNEYESVSSSKLSLTLYRQKRDTAPCALQ